MSSEQQQIDEKSTDSETYTPQQWDVAASEVSESVASRSVANVPTVVQDNDNTYVRLSRECISSLKFHMIQSWACRISELKYHRLSCHDPATFAALREL